MNSGTPDEARFWKGKAVVRLFALLQCTRAPSIFSPKIKEGDGDQQSAARGWDDGLRQSSRALEDRQNSKWQCFSLLGSKQLLGKDDQGLLSLVGAMTLQGGNKRRMGDRETKTSLLIISFNT